MAAPFPALKRGSFAPLFPVVSSLQQIEAVCEAARTKDVTDVRLELSSGELSSGELSSCVALCEAAGVRLWLTSDWKLAIEKGAFGVHLDVAELAGCAVGGGLGEIRRAGLRLGLRAAQEAELDVAAELRPSYVSAGGGGVEARALDAFREEELDGSVCMVWAGRKVDAEKGGEVMELTGADCCEMQLQGVQVEEVFDRWNGNKRFQREPFQKDNARPMGWYEAVRVVKNYSTLHHLGRSPANETSYMESRARTQEKYASSADLIKVEKFGLPRETDDERGKIRAGKGGGGGGQLRLTENDFPYYFDAGIAHYVLWKLGEEALTQSEIDAAMAELKEREGAKRCSFWINPPELKSIPELDHAHIIVLCGRP
ncbi:hypothetical protein TeGR_g12736 [Tetraparma gracilis]|uniref:Uncharacterized protein n=1 Tax=Tetraparma gracilis TaxID=2962635 RepID=A0ABQ6MQF3_9STRA|nr:hypothetical protein TeGR_g12736 [Tetraparma gracilis]